MSHPEFMRQISELKGQGKTKALVFGRFQPLHPGHQLFFNAVLQSGLELHIFLNSKANTPDGRNPYTVRQKRRMFELVLPQSSQVHFHDVHVYLGGGGDVGNDVRTLIKAFETVGPVSESVIFCTEKPVDIKSYTADGVTHEKIHYVDLLVHPRGPFSKQSVPPEISRVNGVEISATLFRKGTRYDLLSPKVAQYVRGQHYIASLNGRNVGDDNSNDQRVVNTTLCQVTNLHIGWLQLELLREGKTILFR